MKKILFMFCLIASSVWATKPQNVLRAYQLQEGGYVMLDANNEVAIVSESGDVNSINRGLQQYLDDAGVVVEIMSEKATLKATDIDFNDPVGPLLGDIMYNQTYPYNLDAPKIGDDYCLTGCVATAMAQIMTYWRYPAVCSNVTVEYTTATRNYPIKYEYNNVAFDWDNILPNYEIVETTDIQNKAIAKLMKACGVSVHMNYDLGGSGTGSPLVVDALVNIFGYKRGLRFEEKDKDMTSDEFCTTLMEEFDAARPVYCSGVTDNDEGGHAFVIDGYKTVVGKENDPRYVYFHFNWGWGGKDNDWIRINSNTPYSKRMQMIRQIMPANMTALENVENEQADQKIYDILGREVSETTAGHIYIRNGKKFIAQ